MSMRRNSSRLRAVLGLLILVLALCAPAPCAKPDDPAPQQAVAGARVWLDAQGNPLPFKNDDEILDFLRTAEVISDKPIPSGVTSPHKLMLRKNGIQANAVFRNLDEEKDMFVSSTGVPEMNFRDSYFFEPAAYEVARLLGLDSVPPAVLRKVHGHNGSIQIWVENAMSEESRRKKDLRPPDQQRWNKQIQMIIMFDALIYNTDRHPRNILITPDWKVWMIDHSRAFRRLPKLQDENKITRCDRALYERLKTMDATVVQQRLKDVLRSEEIKTLLKRRELIVNRLGRLIAEKGESAVLFDLGQ